MKGGWKSKNFLNLDNSSIFRGNTSWIPPGLDPGLAGIHEVGIYQYPKALSPIYWADTQLGPVRIEVVNDRDKTQLWNEYVMRYHYLSYKRPFGYFLRYFVLYDQLKAMVEQWAKRAACLCVACRQGGREGKRYSINIDVKKTQKDRTKHSPRIDGEGSAVS